MVASWHQTTGETLPKWTYISKCKYTYHLIYYNITIISWIKIEQQTVLIKNNMIAFSVLNIRPSELWKENLNSDSHPSHQFSCPVQDRHKNVAGLHKFIPFQPSHPHQNILLYFTTKFQMAQMTHFSILHSGDSFLKDGPIKALSSACTFCII